eukprot:g50848.t1
MFATSTQKSSWIFQTQSEIDAKREDAFRRSLESLQQNGLGETPMRINNHSVNSTLDHDSGISVLSPMPSLGPSAATSPSLSSSGHGFPKTSSLSFSSQKRHPAHSLHARSLSSSSGSNGSMASVAPSPWDNNAQRKAQHQPIFTSPELSREDAMRMSISPAQPASSSHHTPSLPVPTPASSPAAQLQHFKLPPQDMLNLQQRAQLLKILEALVFEIAKGYEPPLPVALQATAITFFKRYYLRASIRTHHPAKMLLTCVYLAKKVEECALELLGLVKTPCLRNFWLPHERDDETEREKTVVSLEVPLLEGLMFHLRCYHPFKPLLGLILAMDPPLGKEERPVVEEKARKMIVWSLLTDAMLLHAPSQIAMAALAQALCECGWESVRVDELVEDLAAKAKLPKNEWPKLRSKLVEIAQLHLKRPQLPDPAEQAELWRKFDCMRDQRYVKYSEAWKLEEKRREEISDAKRNLKLDHAKRARPDDSSLLSEPLVRTPEGASPGGFMIRRRPGNRGTPTPVGIRTRPTPPHPFAGSIPEMSPF